MKITIDELRNILFYVNDQNMSVSELRAKLFKIDDKTEYTDEYDLCTSFTKNNI